ncbi:hypothetical protein CHARACLAT_015569 [Characodon lateralis]|uniref:Uncharacterized protein n=1 Tax=Characodon lateralis TaxID=208331 RepID=A0ABU7DH35_9TELE|nr:hypothetical protein [Characodon lateralis]
MDHGLFEMEGGTMSQVHVDGFELCDNLSNSEALTAQTRNFNETLAQTLSQTDEGGTCSSIQKTSLDNNGKEEVEIGKEEYLEGSRNVDEEEDVDQVMKEEEEEESETSSSLICCQSPDTLMTDSSYSETGSLLETPYPFSPRTSPEPTSPVIPVLSLETLHPINSFELSPSSVEVISRATNSELDSTATEAVNYRQVDSVDLTSHVTTSGTQLGSSSGPKCSTVASNTILKDSCPEQPTSSKEHVSNCGPTVSGETSSSSTGPVISAGLSSSTESTLSRVTAQSSTFTTGSNTTAKEFTKSSLPTSLNQEQFTSTLVPEYSLVSTCSTGSILSPALLESLEEQAESDDGTHLPHYLHQIAETFVLQKDCILASLLITRVGTVFV